MHTTYYPDDDILEIRFTDRPIVREVSQGWNTCLSYDAEDNVVEMVILDAQAIGAWPAETHRRAA
ncbi:DUF2283 domain-containing protein [Methylomagnum sp.]